MDADQEYFWDLRFRTEGCLWGTKPSPTLEILLSQAPNIQSVFEFGFGYGRDLLHLAKSGRTVDGIDLSSEGLRMAAQSLQSLQLASTPCLLWADFIAAPIEHSHYDSVFSHRTLHLVPNANVASVVEKITQILKPGGRIYISARDPRDFDDTQMRMVGENTAEYKTRRGHLINFWNQDTFIKFFGSAFRELEFTEGREQESISNPGTYSYFTIMSARLKSHSA